MSEIRYIDIADFRALGLIAEINRQLLHPLGFALEVTVDDTGTERISGVWDYRDDPEGIYFDGDAEYMADVADKARSVAALLAERAPAREAGLGYVIQPVGE